jgi:hypothetical protein
VLTIAEAYRPCLHPLACKLIDFAYTTCGCNFGRYDRMNALLKSSMLLLPASAIAVYLYVLPGDEGFDPVRSQPHEDICKRDGDRLAQLQAKPSLDEALRFGSELRCLQLWPQVETVLDSLSHTARSTAVSSLNGAAPDMIPASEAAPATASPAVEATSTTSDDACKQDEDRLARLRTTPSSEEAARSAQDLRCETLRPQLLALTGALAKPSPPDSQSVSQDAGAGTSALNDAPPSEAAKDSGEAAQAIDAASPPAKPAPKAASETAGVAQPLTPNLDLPAKPSGKSSARVVVARTDPTAPSVAMETPSRPVQLGTPVKSEKAARVSPKAPQATEPQAGLPASHAFAQQSVNPLARALAHVFGELVGAMGVPAGWAVQLAAPKSETEANSDVARLNAKYASVLNGAAIGVHKAQVNGATVYRLRVVGLSKADAAALCGRVKGGGGDCFIAKATASPLSKGGRRVSGATELPEETKWADMACSAVHVGTSV